MFGSLKQFSFLFYGLLLLFMIAVLAESTILHYAVKPLFMLLLIGFVRYQTRDANGLFSRVIQFGLFFSWLGDIALMLPDTNGMLFIAGLVSFLIAHLGYSFAFYHSIKNSSSAFSYPQSLFFALPFVLFTGTFFYYIKDGLGEFYLPVLAYTLVISMMGIFSAWRYGHVDTRSFKWIMIGAILFIISDCILALNIFDIQPEKNSIVAKALAIGNMITYLSGQFLIAVGAVFYTEALSSPVQDP